jgi:hypothetical protein
MSTALTTAIYRRLAGLEVLTGAALAQQQALAALLGTDPDTALPAVHKGNKSNVVTYPAITFRSNAGAVNSHFATSGIAVDDVIYDLEIWSNTQSGTIIEQIYGCVERLLDGRFGISPALPVDNAGGRIFWATAFVPITELYDRDLRAWFGLCRFRFVEARF